MTEAAISIAASVSGHANFKAPNNRETDLLHNHNGMQKKQSRLLYIDGEY